MTGFPHPDVLDAIFGIMMESDNLGNAISEVNLQKRQKGISLHTLIQSIGENLMTYDLPQDMVGMLYKRLAEIEYRLSLGCNEEIQTSSLVAAFFEARHCQQ